MEGWDFLGYCSNIIPLKSCRVSFTKNFLIHQCSLSEGRYCELHVIFELYDANTHFKCILPSNDHITVISIQYSVNNVLIMNLLPARLYRLINMTNQAVPSKGVAWNDEQLSHCVWKLNTHTYTFTSYNIFQLYYFSTSLPISHTFIINPIVEVLWRI